MYINPSKIVGYKFIVKEVYICVCLQRADMVCGQLWIWPFIRQMVKRFPYIFCNAGINSIRGINGGYILAKSASDITVGDILRALEGNLCVVECPQDSQGCDKFDSCVTKYVWKRINDSINEVVDHMTLEEVISNSCVHTNKERS